jgi:hypothetical protein
MSIGVPAKSAGVIVGTGYAIHLSRDAIEQSEAIVSVTVDIKVGTPREEGEVRMAAKAVERGLQTVGGSIQVKGVVCADDEVDLSLQVGADGFPVAV